MMISLRPTQADDEAFLFTLYALSRRAEMASWGWPEAQQQLFLRMQFTARQAHYKTQFAAADHHIIMLDDQPIGRMVVVRKAETLRLADIALLPEYRGQGIGATLIGQLLDEARRAAKPLQLFVERDNPAIRLYARLGFVQIGDIDSHLSLEWRADNI
ncbi:MAG: GNAT family N-acetyltransferase [Acidobacteria bacterium]|nr:GNAT family N-acetyltransferase [Acidobacteriota bacterium]